MPRAILAGVLAAGAAGLFTIMQSGIWLLLGLAMVLAAVVLAAPLLGVRALDHLLYLRRAAHWQRLEGKHHAFGDVLLAIEDDGRHVWVAAADLQRALRTRDREDVIAARHTNRWRRDARGRLQLRVDAVVEVLATAPGRMDPHTVRLRRYFEREVLYPAQQRRSRGSS